MIINDPKALANNYNFFSKVSSDNNYNEDFLIHKTEMEFEEINLNSNNSEEYNARFSIKELEKSIKVSQATTPGEDDIHYDFIKQISGVELGKLLIYYNKLWMEEVLSDEWNEVVVPVLKSGKDPHVIL